MIAHLAILQLFYGELSILPPKLLEKAEEVFTELSMAIFLPGSAEMLCSSVISFKEGIIS